MIYPNRDALSGMWENTFGGAKSVPPVSDTAALPANKPGNDLANQPATSQQDISQPEKTVSEEARELERRIQVEILNGCGVRGLADRTTNFLRAQGIDVVSNGNFDNFDVLTTRILDRSDNHERAAKVAELFGLSSDRILLRKDAGLQLDVTIVLGADYKSLKPFKN